jgi:type VI secretion system protein ImpF
MARVHEDPTVIASLLNRLTDENPGSTQEAVPLRLHDVDQLRASVAKDLEALLNTRREYLDALPEHYSEVERSVLLYGLPDFTSYSLKSQGDRQSVLQAVEEAIMGFEPRLRDVRVQLIPEEGIGKTMHFRVDGMLKVEPAPEPVTFDTVLHLSTQEYEVKEER